MKGDIVGLVPVKGSSERVKGKNIRPFHNTNLYELKLKQLKKVQGFANVIVSSENSQILETAKKNGFDVSGILINYIKTIGLQQRLKKQPETKSEYWERAFNHIIDNMADYYTFLEVPRSNDEISTIINDITEIVSHIEYCHQRRCFPRHPDSCNEYRRWCEYSELCTGRYNEYEVSKRKVRHTEYSSKFIENINSKIRNEEFKQPF